MALSALHLVHGELPSHFDFLSRQRSQALPTRFRMLSVDSDDDVLCGPEVDMIDLVRVAVMNIMIKGN